MCFFKNFSIVPKVNASESKRGAFTVRKTSSKASTQNKNHTASRVCVATAKPELQSLKPR